MIENLESFKKALRAYAEISGRKLSDDAVLLYYYAVAEHMTEKVFTLALTNCSKHEKFMATPATLLEYAVGSYGDRAYKDLAQLANGNYDDLSPSGAATLEQLGGVYAFKHCKQEFYRKEFLAVYRINAQRLQRGQLNDVAATRNKKLAENIELRIASGMAVTPEEQVLLETYKARADKDKAKLNQIYFEQNESLTYEEARAVDAAIARLDKSFSDDP